jgi:hypothetical protein
MHLQGKAEVIFSRRSDALSAVKKFHGTMCPFERHSHAPLTGATARTLDGNPMEVKLAGEEGKDNPFNPTLEDGDNGSGMKNGNVREGLFGTALGGGDDEG